MQAALAPSVCIGPISLYTVVGVTVNEFRLENVRRLIASVGGPAKFADKVGKSDSQIAQIAGRNPSRKIGYDQAREIEAIFELEVGALDRPPPKSAIVEQIAIELERRAPEAQKSVLDLVLRIPEAPPPALPLAASALIPRRKKRRR